ncbi:GEM-like protein 4 [Quillaja saponaria]|uniref:GEM-like protein 4 n=1 Tax=Quillaja saponaria TaxID=32244 RepID=A0AAD7Q5W7_QUISA|nr:GEM-like protein 4 [Quillaja saponaria]
MDDEKLNSGEEISPTLLKVLQEIPKLEVQVPGREVPDWFDHRSKGGSVSFWVRRKFPVIAVCSVYGGPGGLDTYVQFEVCMSINGVRVYTYKDSFSLESRLHVWLHDLRAYVPPQQWQTLDKYLEEDWNQVEISFVMSTGTVKCCGVHVYKKESNMEDIQFSLPNAHTALVPYQSKNIVGEKEDEVSCTEDEKIDNTLQLLKYFRIPKTTDKEKSIMAYYNVDETKMWARGTIYAKEKTSQDDKQTSDEEDKREEKIEQKRTFREKSLSFVYRMSEHVRLRSKLSETMTSTLNFGAAFIVIGGRDNIFKNTFGLKDGEELLNASHCYKYTTAAPIPGALFISTEKVAFCSEDFDDKYMRKNHKVRVRILFPMRPVSKVHEVSDETARSPETQVIQEKEKEKETISETLMNTLNLGSKLVEQSGLEKISFLRKKLPSPFKS